MRKLIAMFVLVAATALPGEAKPKVGNQASRKCPTPGEVYATDPTTGRGRCIAVIKCSALDTDVKTADEALQSERVEIKALGDGVDPKTADVTKYSAFGQSFMIINEIPNTVKEEVKVCLQTGHKLDEIWPKVSKIAIDAYFMAGEEADFKEKEVQALLQHYNKVVAKYNHLLNTVRAAQASGPQTAPPSTTASSATSHTKATPLTVCAQQPPATRPVVVSFAVADSNGVHPGVMGWTKKWVRKNARKFPDVSFQDCPAQGAQNYLIVFSTSTNVLSGFDPVVKTNTSTSTSSVSGSGTATDSSGSTWNFTFDGDVDTTTTTTTQENVPYTIQSNTLYATAYNQQGAMVSQRWHVFRSKRGGDVWNSAGYNLGSALFAIDARGRLLHAVVKDIVKKSK